MSRSENVPLINTKISSDGESEMSNSFSRNKMLISGSLVFAALLLTVAYLAPSNDRKFDTAAIFKSTSADSTAYEYKFTISIANGTYTEVSDFIASYVSPIESTSDLGCGTMKVVSETIDGFELHWVDSAIFTQYGRTIGEWADYVESVGIDNYNYFLHNKIQLYTPDMQAVYNAVNKDNVKALFRLSQSTGGIADDTAHITLFPSHTAAGYELVGPASTLDSTSLQSFVQWSAIECPESQVLPNSISYYAKQYSTLTATTEMTTWETSTGLKTPMKVQSSMPVSDLDKFKSTLELLENVSGAEITMTSSADGTCKYAYILNTYSSVPTETSYIVYVQNDNYDDSSLSLTLSDWENEIFESHTQLVKDTNGWDRYLDTHYAYELSYGDSCSNTVNAVSDTIEKLGFNVGLRVTTTTGTGTHFYTGVFGIRSWEFNIDDCVISEAYPDICGCEENNNDKTYYIEYGKVCGSD